MSRASTIVVVCTGNICRSPMAEGMFRHRLTEAGLGEWEVSSRGVSAVVGHPATAEAQEATSSFGIDISAHRARQLTRDEILKAGLLLTLESWHRDWILEKVPEAAAWTFQLSRFDALEPARDIADPYGQTLAIYRMRLDEILDAIKGWTQFLATRGDDSDSQKQELEEHS